MSGYLIVNYTVDDPDLYREYQGRGGAALKVGTESELLVFDQNSQALEGENIGKSTVVLKFESLEKAREIYESGDYQAVIGKRLGATSNHFAVLADGFG